MAVSAKHAMLKPKLKVLADRGYFSGPEIRTCDLSDISAYVPKPLTSASRKKGLFTKADFVHVEKDDMYRSPAGGPAIHRFNNVEDEMNLRVYSPSACPRYAVVIMKVVHI